MSTTDQMFFREKIMRYKTSYDDDRDASRYVSNSVVAALNLWLNEKNEMLRKMGKPGLVLPAALSMSSPLFMAAIDSVADAVSCPVDKRMSALEFLKHFGDRVQSRYDSEYAEPVKNALKSVQDGLRSLGLVS